MKEDREDWMQQAAVYIRAYFADLGYELPEVRVSCSWPSKSGLGARSRRIGECWSPKLSADGKPHVFVSPVLDDSMTVLGVLLHELVHATVGTEEGHAGKFKTLAVAAGLIGKMTSTKVGPDLEPKLQAIIDRIGPYPHSKIDIDLLKHPKKDPITGKEPRLTSGPPKQTTRMLKAACDCGYTVRISRKWAEVALPLCPVCETHLQLI